jgi:hypothetical protein
MSNRLKRAGSIFAIAAALALLGPGVYASSSGPESGAWTITLTPQTVTSSGGNTIIEFTLNETISGTVSGTRVGGGTLVLHPDGTLVAHDAGTFTGTVDGVAGTGTLVVDASGTFSALTGRVVLHDGKGCLNDVRGRFRIAGSAIGPTTFAGTYTGRVHFGGEGASDCGPRGD